MGNEFLLHLNQNTTFRWNVFENVVCKMVAILYRPSCAKFKVISDKDILNVLRCFVSAMSVFLSITFNLMAIAAIVGLITRKAFKQRKEDKAALKPVISA